MATDCSAVRFSDPKLDPFSGREMRSEIRSVFPSSKRRDFGENRVFRDDI